MIAPQEQFDRLPPYSLEAEMCLLGSLMLAGDDRGMFAAVRAILEKDAFYSADHQIIFETLCQLHERGKAIDGVIVREALIARGVLEEVGGVAMLAQLLNAVPSAAHAAHYARIVREKAILRRGIALCNNFLAKAYSQAVGDAADELAMELGQNAVRLATTGKADRVHTLEDVLHEIIEQKESRVCPWIATGLASLDRVIGGLRIGGKTIIGAKPGMGKSQLVKQIARNVASCGIAFGIISVEEDSHKIGENMLAAQSGIPNNRIAFGTIGREEWQEVAKATARLAKLPIFIVDSARRLSDIVAAAHVLATQHGCGAIAVDHLHIIDGESVDHREREISKISAELKWLWKELKVAGIEAAQLNRASGRERPALASLRDSGSLEQDGDTILLLHREDYYRHSEPGYHEDQVMEILVAKNKSGATGTVPVHFDGARQRVGELDPSEGVAAF